MRFVLQSARKLTLHIMQLGVKKQLIAQEARMDQHHQQEHVRNAPVDIIRWVGIQSAKHVKVVCIKTLQHKISVKIAQLGNINRSHIKRTVF